MLISLQSATEKNRHQGKAHRRVEQSSDSDDQAFAVQRVNSKAPRVKVSLNDHSIEFIVDTGATVNIISQEKYNAMPNKPTLSSPVPKVFAYGSKTELHLLGKFTAQMVYKGIKLQDTILVTLSKSPLCFKSAEALGLVSIVYKVASSQNIQSAYPRLFEGLGKLQGIEVKLHIDKSVPPVAQKLRPIPFSVRDAVTEEVERLEKLDVIEKATGPTTWVSPIVAVPKPHSPGVVRICVDMRRANQAITRERHASPTLEDLVTSLTGASVFSKLDLNDGHHQLVLHEESRHITTFNLSQGGM